MRVRMLAKYAIPYRRILRCPVKRGKGIIYDDCNSNFFASKWTHPGLNLCVFSDIYESETWDAQVDGSLPLCQAKKCTVCTRFGQSLKHVIKVSEGRKIPGLIAGASKFCSWASENRCSLAQWASEISLSDLVSLNTMSA